MFLILLSQYYLFFPEVIKRRGISLAVNSRLWTQRRYTSWLSKHYTNEQTRQSNNINIDSLIDSDSIEFNDTALQKPFV